MYEQVYRFEYEGEWDALREKAMQYYQQRGARPLDRRGAALQLERIPPVLSRLLSVSETEQRQTITISLDETKEPSAVVCHYRVQKLTPGFFVIPPHRLEEEVRGFVLECARSR